MVAPSGFSGVPGAAAIRLNCACFLRQPQRAVLASVSKTGVIKIFAAFDSELPSDND